MIRNLSLYQVVIKLMKESFYIIRDIKERTEENALLMNIVESNFFIKKINEK